MAHQLLAAIDGGSYVGVGILQSEQDFLRLGLVWIDTPTVTLAEFRQILDENLSACPPLYSFLTKDRWRISEEQESHVALESILCEGHIAIQRDFDEPRVGISLEDGKSLGFIFTRLDIDLTALREAIGKQLESIKELSSVSRYNFVDSHGWVVATDKQEAQLKVLDIASGDNVVAMTTTTGPAGAGGEGGWGCARRVRIRVRPPENTTVFAISHERRRSSCSQRRRSQGCRSQRSINGGSASPVGTWESPTLVQSAAMKLPSSAPPNFRLNKNSGRTRRLSASSGGGKKRGIKMMRDGTDGGATTQQVLISYVRAEASQHALQLKTALVNQGFNVFLDVHEIKFGGDWQDSLNMAVSTCRAFIPLVTPRYGETLWTNREVKLADVLSKTILPVCFLKKWPPRCLAIQFATTQYVPWRTPQVQHQAERRSTRLRQVKDEVDGGGSDGMSDDNDNEQDEDEVVYPWEEEQVESVASDIAERILESEGQHTPALLKKVTSLRSCPVPLPDGYDILSQSRAGKPMVVISAHPRQAKETAQVVDWLQEEGYEVWCSLDHYTQDELDAQHKEYSQDYSEKAQINRDETVDMSHGLIGLSQLSENSSITEQQNRQRKFRMKADEAGVIIFLVSKLFAKSKTSAQQLCYCDQRKRLIVVQCAEFCMPNWLSNRINNHCTKLWCAGFKKSLLKQVRNALNGDTEEDASTFKSSQENPVITTAAGTLRAQIPGDNNVFVYVSGSTKFYNNASKLICQEIGSQLAVLHSRGLCVATGGFNGVGQVVGEAFRESISQNQNKPDSANSGRNANQNKLDSGRNALWHILPYRDEEDFSEQAPQQEDRTFRKLTSGVTLFSGNSVTERESIVAKVFDICILIEGGPGAAHEAQAFMWNDRLVIPVPCTGGAAAGKFSLSKESIPVPLSVSKDDWDVLCAPAPNPPLIGKAVVNIVTTYLDDMEKERAMKTSVTIETSASKNGEEGLYQNTRSREDERESRESSPEFTRIQTKKKRRVELGDTVTSMFARTDTLPVRNIISG